MVEDYYQTLGIIRDAQPEDIRSAFHKLALHYHPRRNDALKPKHAERRFRRLCEAHEVLSDAKLRGIYDRYGEEGLKDGGAGNIGVPGGWSPSEPEKVFHAFFGVSNPFEMIGDFSGMSLDQHKYFSVEEGNAIKDPKKVPPHTEDLLVTLEELYTGAEKTFLAAIRHLDDEGNVVKTEEVTFVVQVPNGTAEGALFTYPGRGDLRPGWRAGDMQFVIRQVPHSRFTRQGNDLHYIHPITLEHALCGLTLEGDPVVPVHPFVSPPPPAFVITTLFPPSYCCYLPAEA
eukprot:gene3377-641_t